MGDAHDSVEKAVAHWIAGAVDRDLDSFDRVWQENAFVRLFAFAPLDDLKSELRRAPGAAESLSTIQDYLYHAFGQEQLLSAHLRAEVEAIGAAPSPQLALLQALKLVFALLSARAELPPSFAELLARAEDAGQRPLRQFLAEALSLAPRPLSDRLRLTEEQLCAAEEQVQLLTAAAAEAQRKSGHEWQRALDAELRAEALQAQMARNEDAAAERLAARLAEARQEFAARLAAQERLAEQLLARAEGLQRGLAAAEQKAQRQDRLRAAAEERLAELGARLQQEYVPAGELAAQSAQASAAREELSALRDELALSRIEGEHAKAALASRLAEGESAWRLRESQLILESDHARSEALLWRRQAEDVRVHSPRETSRELAGPLESINVLDESVDISTLAACRRCAQLEHELEESKALAAGRQARLAQAADELQRSSAELAALREAHRDAQQVLRAAERRAPGGFARQSVGHAAARPEASRKSLSEVSFSSDLLNRLLGVEADNKRLRAQAQVLAQELEGREGAAAEELEIVYAVCEAFHAHVRV